MLNFSNTLELEHEKNALIDDIEHMLCRQKGKMSPSIREKLKKIQEITNILAVRYRMKWQNNIYYMIHCQQNPLSIGTPHA